MTYPPDPRVTAGRRRAWRYVSTTYAVALLIIAAVCVAIALS